VIHQMERPKSSLGSVRIEEFSGERFRYTKWKKAVEAQQQLYRLEEQELAMLVYLSTKRDARDCLDQAPISEFTRAGGLRLVWRLLDEAFGETEDEQFERAEKEYNQYRRLPGQAVSAYIGQMKRLKAQYQRVDPESQISDRAWGQRLLNRCSLSRRERLDVFFSAGGLYDPVAIERALRHRCANTHEDERRVPNPTRNTKVSKPRYYDEKKKTGYKKVYKRIYVAGGEDEDEEQGDEAEEEDLEAEGLEEQDVFYEDQAEDPEELTMIQEEDNLQEDGEEVHESLKEAYAAGWKAKAKMNDKKNNTIHFTYAVTTHKKTKTEEVKTSGPMMVSCPQCRWPTTTSAKFCSQCGHRFDWDQRMAEGKRGWTVVSPEEEDEEQVPSSESSKPDDKPKMYRKLKKIEQRKIKASSEEVLAALPMMSKSEKKQIKKVLMKEEHDAAFERLDKGKLPQHYASSSSEEGDPAARASGHQLPVNPKTKGTSGGYMEEAKKKDLPKPVRDKMLAKFRLRWSANGDGHYAACKDCGLKSVIYFSERHGAWVASQEVETPPQEVFVTSVPGMAIMDSGCRTAVAGLKWHMDFQEMLKEKGLSWHEEDEQETFQFGSGGPEESQKAYIYPVGIHGFHDVIRMSCVGGGAASCPGLIGPSEMARWGVVMDFANKKLQIKGSWQQMALTSTRHPAVCLLDFGSKLQEFWEDEEIKCTLKMLRRAPQSWAFSAEHRAPSEEESSGDESSPEIDEEACTSEEEGEQGQTMKALQRLEHDLAHIPLQEAERNEDDGDWELVNDTDETESITSHEFGVHEEEGSEETSSDEEMTEHEVYCSGIPKKHCSKKERSEVAGSIKEIQKIYIQRQQEEKKGKESRTMKIPRRVPRAPRKSKKMTEEDREVEEQAKRDLEEFDAEMERQGIRPDDPRLRLPSNQVEEEEPLMIEEDEQEFWRSVQAQERAYDQEDEERKRQQEERRKKLLDDVPMSLKRKSEPKEEEEPRRSKES
ncbi:Retrovirus-related Pol polyprotein from transposon TNT 1-94, partial [Durusdinium trenchii]